jgi:hypothetical protein
MTDLRHRLTATCVSLVVLACGCVGTAERSGLAAPEPASSQFFETANGGFKITHGVVFLALFLKVTSPPPTGSVIRAEFEDPCGGSPLAGVSRVFAGQSSLSFISPPVSCIRAFTAYRAVVRVFADAASSQPLSTHEQLLRAQFDSSRLKASPELLWGGAAFPSRPVPPAPAGFSWVRASNLSACFLQPDHWFAKEENDNAIFITRESIAAGGLYKVGLTAQVLYGIRKEKGLSASQFASQLVAELSQKLHVLESREEASDPKTRTFVLRTEDSEHTILHQKLVARDAEDVVYVAIFEAPAREWDAAWSGAGAPLMENLFQGVGGEC